MRTMHPTLLVGPADWDRARMPREEFQSRIAALWRDHPQAGGAIVYGNSFDHAALAFLTGFTPKLEASLALIPRAGEPQLLIGGGVNMIAAARPLTWVEQLKPLRTAAATAAEWANTLRAGSRILLIGGDAMPFDMRHAFDAALAGRLDEATEMLQAHMLRKGPRELAVMREACAKLSTAVAAMRKTHATGAHVTEVLLAAEHAAQQGGAQDVRSLFSLDQGRTLRPFEMPLDVHADPLQAYVAVRHGGYWAEGFVRASTSQDPLGAKAQSVLKAMIAAAKPGVTCRALADVAAAARGPLQAHPMTENVFGNAIGLALEEPPLLMRGSDATLTAGAVHSLRAGVLDGEGAGAIVSAMLRITDGGNEILWSSGDAA
jgi:Xaa-Pro aminopeptidase